MPTRRIIVVVELMPVASKRYLNFFLHHVVGLRFQPVVQKLACAAAALAGLPGELIF
jgi:hypothetical protein